MIVVEASAIVDALVGDPVNPQLLATLADEQLHAPALLDFEVASALRGHLLAGRLDAPRVEEAVDDFVVLTIERYLMTSSLNRILELRDNFTAYDAAYVLLAETLEAPLVTADDKLAQARRIGIDVRVMRPPANA